MTHAGQLKWYLDRRGAVSGPYTLSDLARLLEINEADLRDMAQAEGTKGWIPLAEVIRGANAAAQGPAVARPTAQATLGPSAPPTPAASRFSYGLRHWRGELSLGVSYWVNSVVVSLIMAAAIGGLSSTDALQGRQPRSVATWLTGALAVILAVSIWQVVGTWRSADKHTARGGRRFWAVAAKVMLCVGAIRGVAEFGMAAVTASNAWRHAAAIEGLPSTAFLLLRGGTEVEFAGGIRPGTAARLNEVLNGAPRARIMHLDSPGGDLGEAHAMAALVRARGMDTYVRSSCLSACTSVFLAGRNRLLKEDARLGFHAPTVVAAGSEGVKVVEAERTVMAASDVPEWFVTRAFTSRGSDMWLPTTDELTSARVVTFVTDGAHLSPGRPAAQVASTEVEDSIRKDVLGAALAAANPAAIRELSSSLSAIRNDGGTVDDGVAALERAVAPLYAEALKRLPDKQIVAAVRTIVETAKALGARDARVCRDWIMRRPGDPVPAIAPLLPAQQRQALTQVMADVITMDADPRQRMEPPLRKPPQLQAVVRRLESRLPRAQIEFFDAPADTSLPPATVCAAVTEFFAEILRLPEREAGAVLRYLFANA